MNVDTVIAILGAVFTVISGLVIATWVLSNKIGSISETLAVHAAATNEKITDIRRDVDNHDEKLDQHDRRLTTIETGEGLKAFVEAAQQLTGRSKAAHV